MSKLSIGCGLAIALSITFGCSQNEEGAPATGSARGAGSAYLVSSEPTGAVGVAEVRQSAGDEREVTVVGRIGGSTKPFVDGLAAFTIVDPQVPYCMPDEGCPTPWDYCCQTHQLKDNSAVVKVVDDAGKPIATDARELLGVKELAVVVVRGEAQRDEEGNLTIVADRIFIREEG